MDQYAVIGNPVAHSLSPRIHRLFARQTRQQMEYGKILGEDFVADVKAFFAAGGKGLNVTVPFKEQAWQLVDERTERAETAGAVNTLIPLDQSKLQGDNTDGMGLVNDLGCNHRFGFRHARILLLGAGGASRGVARPLLQQGIKELVIANRTASKAETLASELTGLGKVSGCGLDALAQQRFDLIVNGTAAGFTGNLPKIPADCLADGGWTYDMMYGAAPTAFVLWGRKHHAARALDGLGMLVEQAAEAFYLWRGVRPDTGPVIRLLRQPAD